MRAGGRKKGEAVTLHCSHCSWGTELPMEQTHDSCVVACAHCGKPIHWHCCGSCGLCYAGTAVPNCPICSDTSLDDPSLDDPGLD